MSRTKRNILQGKRHCWKKDFTEDLERGLVNHPIKNNKPGFYSRWLDIWDPIGKKQIKQTRNRYDRRVVEKEKLFEDE